jgi:hypothetical protein
VLPLLYLHGLSSGDFVPASQEFFGSAGGLSASAVGRLTTDWQDEQRTFAQRDLSGVTGPSRARPTTASRPAAPSSLVDPARPRRPRRPPRFGAGPPNAGGVKIG